MSLTKEALLELREAAVGKRQQLLEMIQQANGAIDMLDVLIAKLSQPADNGAQGVESTPGT